MGKYLDIARAFEARRAEGRVSPQRQETPSPACSWEDAFLEKHVSPDALQAFPDWQGLLIKSAVLDMSVWVVRNRQDGASLARETGQPALLLDDVLRQKGRTAEEARAAVLPVLIMAEQ